MFVASVLSFGVVAGLQHHTQVTWASFCINMGKRPPERDGAPLMLRFQDPTDDDDDDDDFNHHHHNNDGAAAAAAGKPQMFSSSSSSTEAVISRMSEFATKRMASFSRRHKAAVVNEYVVG